MCTLLVLYVDGSLFVVTLVHVCMNENIKKKKKKLNLFFQTFLNVANVFMVILLVNKYHFVY